MPPTTPAVNSNSLVGTTLSARALPPRSVYGPVDPAAQFPEPRRYEPDRFRISRDAQRPYATTEDRQRELLTRMIGSDELTSARPPAMGPHGARRPVNPLGGVKVGTDLAPGWRLEGAASPRRGGQVGVGIRGVF